MRLHDEKTFRSRPALTVTSTFTYLGDVVSDAGTIDATIDQRGQKAEGITTQIASILSSISLGNFHFDIALVMRDALFTNSIMTNAEVWHNVKLYHVQRLESYDVNLLNKSLMPFPRLQVKHSFWNRENTH